MIKEQYPSVKLIQLNENVGGSGGFNAGMEYVLNQAYQYMLLLDNDVVLARETIALLINEMEHDSDIGLLGAKLLQAGTENILQEFGSFIDWSNYTIKPQNKGEEDRGQLPNMFECDYVPACCVMVRKKTIVEAGSMDQGFFIYWDDIEWGNRIKKHGYKVMTASKPKVWHKMGALQRETTFATYYFWRNRIHFFVNEANWEEKKLVKDQFIKLVFEGIYLASRKNLHSIANTLEWALLDALQGNRGKGLPNRISKREESESQLQALIRSQDRILINLVEEHHIPLINTGLKYADIYQKDMKVVCDDALKQKLLQVYGDKVQFAVNHDCFDHHRIHLCSSILSLDTSDTQADSYADIYENVVDMRGYDEMKVEFEREYLQFEQRIHESLQ